METWYNLSVIRRAKGTRRERWEFYVPNRPVGKCWEWQGHRNELGYGQMRTGKGPLERAHRLAWEFLNGPIPLGIQVLHHCDNPPCVNPAHLWLGTPMDNMRDMTAKGRRRRRPGDLRKTIPRGENAGRAQLTADKVRTIRERYAAGETQPALGREYGVCSQQIGQIVLRRSWAHIE